MLYLAASCIALLFGPLFYRYFSSGSGLQKGLDGFIFVSLGGLVLIHILPELLEHGGFVTLLFVILGLWGPTASERIFHRYSEITHNITLSLGIIGLLLHTITDGGAMVLSQQQGNSPLLALGVILHRLPVGLAIWWLLKPQVGARWASIVLVAMMALTSVGYFAGEQLLLQLSIENTVYLQAFVTGSILHVVLHQPHGEHTTDKQGKYQYQAGIGSLLGLGLLAVLLLMDTGSQAHEHHEHSHGVEQFVSWLLTISPILLLSYLFATLRFKLGLQPQHKNLAVRWLQRLAGPEALIITLALLGPWFALYQIIGLAVIAGLLTWNKISLTDPHLQLPESAWRFGFAHLVDRSAPWILLSLILANLIGHPSVPLENPALQVLILLLVFIPMRFCNLGAVILALALFYSGWNQVAVAFSLLAAPVINIAQLKLMTWKQGLMLGGVLVSAFIVADLVPLTSDYVLRLPESINILGLAIISLLFGASLLRLGPRKFLSRMVTNLKSEHHDHKQSHGHSHHHH
ncbi:metal transporter [Shewanella aestuarii]|uniref:Metal transporter n=1 Tax=Shewanella aestuarii TaxID=1028752 RepID=A0ABT0L527_9GAMM|nr:metal transporter [Shewanella aestuarii]MCL1118520.1 metal transporter [Shewanella aestuarii]GGN82912.1 metal transporter [Shewanella aestuarii]